MNEQNDVSPAAARELDALIAVRVMGFWFEDEHWWTKHRDGGSRAYATAYLNLWGPSYRYDGLPKFSTDIAAAWAVVEKLAHHAIHGSSSGLALKLDSITRVDDDVRWWAQFTPIVWMASAESGETPPAPRNVQEWHETAPLAICRAALKAVASIPSGVTEV